MSDINLQDLISSTEERIRIKQERDKEERIKKQREEERQKKQNTESLAESIKRMIIGILNSCNSRSGFVDKLGDIEKYGTPRNTSWTIEDSKFQIVLDFTYRISGDCLNYCGPRGFCTNYLDWDYLCELLQKDNIIINREEKSTEVDDGMSGQTIFTDIITITVEREKTKTTTKNR